MPTDQDTPASSEPVEPIVRDTAVNGIPDDEADGDSGDAPAEGDDDNPAPAGGSPKG